MYIMRKMNREKKAATDAERVALLADGYRDVTPSALHEDAPAEKEAPVKTGKVPVGKNQDKARDSIKKSKPADTGQKKPVAAADSSVQGTVETENSRAPETTEVSEYTQKETVEGATVPKTQQSVESVGSAQEQSTESTDSVQPSPEASQNPL